MTPHFVRVLNPFSRWFAETLDDQHKEEDIVGKTSLRAITLIAALSATAMSTTAYAAASCGT